MPANDSRQYGRGESGAPVRLDSWKEIAAHLGRDVRTVIRWEKDRGLPVHRIPGGGRKAVFAYTHELDQWLTREPLSNSAKPADSGPALPSSDADLPAAAPRGASRRRLWLGALGLATGLALIAATRLPARWLHAATIAGQPAPAPPSAITRLSGDGQEKRWPIVSDGVRLYFTELVGDEPRVVAVPLLGGETQTVPIALPSPYLQAVSPDGSHLLVKSPARAIETAETPLYLVPALGGAARQVTFEPSTHGWFAPDGRSVLYSYGSDLRQQPLDGNPPHTLASFPGVPRVVTWDESTQRLIVAAGIPAGSALRLWSLNPDGSDLRPLLGGAGVFLGQYAAYDGSNHRLLVSLLRESHGVLWEYRGNARELEAASEPHEIVSTSNWLTGFLISRDGSRMFAALPGPEGGELLQVNSATHALEPFLPGKSWLYLNFSPDGQQVLAVQWPGDTLWRANADGSAPLQLTFPPSQAVLPRWSPDGSEFAFMSRLPNQPYRIYRMSANGGPARRVTSTELPVSEGAPTWSADGRSILFAAADCADLHRCAIFRVDVASGTMETIPGSEGLRTARGSPDGRYIAALRENTAEIMLLEVATGRWRRLAGGATGDDLEWAPDSRSLFGYQRYSAQPHVFRVSVPDGRVQRLASLAGLSAQSLSPVQWLGVGPAGNPIAFHPTVAPEIFALDAAAH